MTNSYDRPIPTPVKNLRPARETCEQCHRPERFAGDLVVTHTTYDHDEANTAHTDTRIMRVGGGEVGVGIHWHIAASVYYLPLDSQRQQIAWVGVRNSDGTMTEYIDPASANQVTPERIAGGRTPDGLRGLPQPRHAYLPLARRDRRPVHDRGPDRSRPCLISRKKGWKPSTPSTRAWSMPTRK